MSKRAVRPRSGDRARSRSDGVESLKEREDEKMGEVVDEDWMRPFDQDEEERKKEDEESAEEGLGQRVATGDDDVHGHGEDGEGRTPVALRAPHRVSREERDVHELTHTPFRAWCPYCVRARGRNTPHTRRSDEMKRGGVPNIAVDYFYMSTADQAASENPVIVMVDEVIGEKYARAVGRKGLGDHGDMDWLIKDMSDELKAWGHPGGDVGHIIIKSDGERSILAVCEALAKYHGGG